MTNSLQRRYGVNLSLLTDLYQLTMAYGYWKHKRAEQPAVFHLFFRRPPFRGRYALAAGLEDAVAWLQDWHLNNDDLAYLATLTDAQGCPLFEAAFLDYLGGLRFTGDLHAIAEGTIVFAHEPLLRITAPLVQAQLVETALLTFLNFQTLIATKAARLVQAAQGDAVLEFGARRAQGIDGGLSASRAAYIGGCTATSNVLAGRLYGIPLQGTHGHSWVMSFETERQAFEAYAEALPSQCVFLVDTYDSLQGIRTALEVGQILRKKGHSLLGIRLDSGDLAQLARQARQLLDNAGFEDAVIVGSDGLDASKIKALKAQGAPIAVWGVGTHLVTASDQPSLGAVYKLGALQDLDGTWIPKIKLSNTPEKISTPGVLQVRRYVLDNGQPFGDMVWQEANEAPEPHFQSFDGRQVVAQDRAYQDLLEPILAQGQLVTKLPDLATIRAHAQAQIALFSDVNFQWYPIGLETKLNTAKIRLLQSHWKTPPEH